MELYLLIFGIIFFAAFATYYKVKNVNLKNKIESCFKHLNRTTESYQSVMELKHNLENLNESFKERLKSQNDLIQDLKKHQQHKRRCKHCKRYIRKDFKGKSCYHCHKDL